MAVPPEISVPRSLKLYGLVTAINQNSHTDGWAKWWEQANPHLQWLCCIAFVLYLHWPMRTVKGMEAALRLFPFPIPSFLDIFSSPLISIYVLNTTFSIIICFLRRWFHIFIHIAVNEFISPEEDKDKKKTDLTLFSGCVLKSFSPLKTGQQRSKSMYSASLCVGEGAYCSTVHCVYCPA